MDSAPPRKEEYAARGSAAESNGAMHSVDAGHDENVSLNHVRGLTADSFMAGSTAGDHEVEDERAPSHTVESRGVPGDYSPHSHPATTTTLSNGDCPNTNTNSTTSSESRRASKHSHLHSDAKRAKHPQNAGPSAAATTTTTTTTNDDDAATVAAGSSTPTQAVPSKPSPSKQQQQALAVSVPENGSPPQPAAKTLCSPSKGAKAKALPPSGVPLWSAIAKTKKSAALKHKEKGRAEEKTPDGSHADSDHSQFNANRRHSTNYWKNRTNHCHSSQSTSSYSSASSKDHHITPSPTPPENGKASKRTRDRRGGAKKGANSRGKSRGGGGGSSNGNGNGNSTGGGAWNGSSSGNGGGQSSSSPSKSGGKGGRCRVFVSNLPPNVTDEDIRSAFHHCGEIANTVWFPSRTDGKFYGSGLITFGAACGSEKALRLNQQSVLGRVIRVEYSSCQDPVKVKPPGCRTIYLNNVPRDAQEARIRQVFRHCGRIKRVRFHERDTKRTGGAFVEFEQTGSCDRALALHGKIVDNHPLYVDYQRY